MPGRSQLDGTPIGSGPPRNTHAVTHGVYHYLATGDLPPEIRQRVDDFSADLDAAIAERHGNGQLPFSVRCRRETAINNYAVAMLRARWTGQELPLTTKDKLVQGALSCLDKRDAKITELDLDRSDTIDVQAVLSEIHREQAAQNRGKHNGNGRTLRTSVQNDAGRDPSGLGVSEAGQSDQNASGDECGDVGDGSKSTITATEGGAI